MHHRKYQKVSDLVGKVRVKYDEDLLKCEAMLGGPGLWSYARFYPVLPSQEPISVKALQKQALEGYRRGLNSVR